MTNGLQAAETALTLTREAGNRKAEVAALQLLADIQIIKEEPRKAELSAQQALELCRSMGYRRAEGASLLTLVFALLEKGESVRAQQIASESLQAFKRAGDRRGEPHVRQRREARHGGGPPGRGR